MEVLSGEFALKRQVGGRGCYARARVQLVEVPNRAHAGVDLAGDERSWLSSVAFGVDYALFLTRERRHFRVAVELHTMLVDSTPPVVAAAVARAVLNALGRSDGALPDADAQDHRVVFPLW